jgi:hypothetical protein
MNYKNIDKMIGMLEFANPIPVIVEGEKEGYAIYVTSGGQFENDIWCVVLCEGGYIRHYRSDQMKMYINATLGITKNKQ